MYLANTNMDSIFKHICLANHIIRNTDMHRGVEKMQ